MLKLELENLDGLEESLHGFYEEQDGVFKLKVDGLEDAVAGKLTLQRVKEERKTALERLAAIESEKVQAEEMRKQAELERLKKEEDYQSLYDMTVKEKQEQTAKFEQLLGSISQDKIESSSVKLSASFAIDDDGARELVTEQVRKYAKYQDGRTFYEIGGVEVTQEAVKKLVSDRYPMLVKGSGAGGASSQGNSGKGGALKTNPFKKGEHFNLTEQGRMMRENPTLATQMMNEA